MAEKCNCKKSIVSSSFRDRAIKLLMAQLESLLKSLEKKYCRKSYDLLIEKRKMVLSSFEEYLSELFIC